MFVSPQDYSSDLDLHLLARVAETIVASRASALAYAKSMPDEIRAHAWWSVACVSYDWTRIALGSLAGKCDGLEYHPEQGLAYTLALGDIPFRVQMDSDVVKPPLDNERALRVHRHKQLALVQERDPYANCVCRLVVDAERWSEVRSIHLKFVDRSSEVVVESWQLYPRVKVPTNVVPLPTVPAEELAPASFELRQPANVPADVEGGDG